MAITATYSGYISVTDNTTGTQALQKVLSSLATTGTIFSEAQTFTVGTSATPISLPVSPTLFMYIKNLSTVNTVTITWTPTGSSSAAILTLAPGACIGYAEPTGSNGITVLSATASGAGTLVEFILAG